MATLKDLRLDAEGELAVTAGDIEVIEDADVVAQMARIRLRTVKGEWYLDEQFGVDYFGRVFTKSLPIPRPVNRGLVEGTFRDALTALPNVHAVTRLEFDYDRAARRFSVDFELDTDFGTVSGSA